MDNKIQEYSSLIEENLYKFFQTSLPQYKELFDSMEYSVKNGGKRVRPLLTLLFYNACPYSFSRVHGNHFPRFSYSMCRYDNRRHNNTQDKPLIS